MPGATWKFPAICRGYRGREHVQSRGIFSSWSRQTCSQPANGGATWAARRGGRKFQGPPPGTSSTILALPTRTPPQYHAGNEVTRGLSGPITCLQLGGMPLVGYGPEGWLEHDTSMWNIWRWQLIYWELLNTSYFEGELGHVSRIWFTHIKGCCPIIEDYISSNFSIYVKWHLA